MNDAKVRPMTLAIAIWGLYLPLLGLGVWTFLALEIKRCHDLGRSGFLVLLNFVPLANVLLRFYLLLAPGSSGANRFGP